MASRPGVAPQPVYATGLGGDRRTLDELLALMRRPAWMADAACREHPELNWFPERGEPSEPAKAVCAGCLVRAECLTYALELGHQGPGRRGGHGVWARAARCSSSSRRRRSRARARAWATSAARPSRIFDRSRALVPDVEQDVIFKVLDWVRRKNDGDAILRRRSRGAGGWHLSSDHSEGSRPLRIRCSNKRDEEHELALIVEGDTRFMGNERVGHMTSAASSRPPLSWPSPGGGRKAV